MGEGGTGQRREDIPLGRRVGPGESELGRKRVRLRAVYFRSTGGVAHLDDTRLASYDGVNRVNPPLREAADALALRQALADGVIDCVATDHAPHAEHEKCVEFAAALPGMLGLQTALSAVVQTMVIPGLLTWRDVARVMSENPARIAGLPDHGRPLEVGEPANLTVVDPDSTWTVAGPELASRSANTPYEAMTLPATVTTTLLRGKITARDGKSPV